MPTLHIRPLPTEAEKKPLSQYPDLVQDLLLARGIDSTLAAEQFLNPSYEDMHDPFLIRGMERAVTRILTALKSKERIAFWTDYDTDGVPSGALLHDFFKKIGYENFENYIPHRHNEGYGLNSEGLTALSERGVTLVVTADSGITDVEPVTHANRLGMDVIVTDHHLPGPVLPPAYEILDLKVPGETYPFGDLCGAGMAFKVVQALIQKGNFELPLGWEKWLLDMAGLATIADMVPLVGENRIIAKYGLVVLRKSPRLGLQKLCRKMNLKQRFIAEDDVGFMIGPRINAASRMGVPMEAFRLLTTTDEDEAETLAVHLNKINNERKGVVAQMAKEIKKRMAERVELREVIVMGSIEWRPALLGLAANSLVEEYNRPVFLWGKEGENTLKGSCRSDGTVDLVALMGEVRDSFIEFGGHKYSGGFSLLHDHLHHLEERLSVAYQVVKDATSIEEPVVIERVLFPEDVDWKLWRALEMCSPYGQGNPKPIFLFKDCLLSHVRWFGKEAQHLEIGLERFDSSLLTTDFFAKGKTYSRDVHTLKGGDIVSVVGTIEKSTFGAAPTLRVRIVDII